MKPMKDKVFDESEIHVHVILKVSPSNFTTTHISKTEIETGRHKKHLYVHVDLHGNKGHQETRLPGLDYTAPQMMYMSMLRMLDHCPHGQAATSMSTHLP